MSTLSFRVGHDALDRGHLSACKARWFIVLAWTLFLIFFQDSPSPTHAVRGQIENHPNRLSTVYLNDLAFAEISKRVATLGQESIVLFVTLIRDGVAHPFISNEAVREIARASGGPVFVLLDTYTGSGTVGGYATRFGEMSKQAGQMGLQFLAGQHPSDQIARSDYLSDGRKLQHWKIPETALAVGSMLINRQPRVWESYKWYILGATLLLLMETMLVLSLLQQAARKRTFQKSLVDQRAFEQMLSDLSSTFLHLPERLIVATIEQNLGRIAKLLKLDRVTLFDYVQASDELRAACSWHNEEIQPIFQDDRFPWCADFLAQGKMIFLPTRHSPPEEALAEKVAIQNLGVASIAVVPLRAGDQLFGAITFASAKCSAFWTDSQVEQLKLLAEIFSNALARERALDARFRHAAIVESSDDAIISQSLDGTILSWNRGAQNLFEYTEAEAVGKSIRILIPEELSREEDKILKGLAAGEGVEHYETVRVTKSGKELNVSLTVSPQRDSKGAILGAFKIARDITERKQAERVLRESEDRFRLVANTAPVLIWMSGVNQMCTFFNQGWLEFTGRSLEQELGEGWADGVHPDDREGCLETYSAAFDARVACRMEYRLQRFDGVFRWIADCSVPRFESNGAFRGYIGSCVDITELKASEGSLHTLSGRLITAQEEERSRIARELHDDFSQRLALLGIGLGQLWKKLPVEGTAERDSILEMLRRTKEISSDLHSLSHQLHSSKLEHVGLAPALAGHCREISKKYKMEVHFIESEKVVKIPKDLSLCLFRVAQEALANAVKHSGSKSVQVELSGSASTVTLRISDSGRGFDPSSQRPNAGIGLIGMSERLRLVGGCLAVKSRPDCGAEILAEVPLAFAGDGIKVMIQSVGR
jgi:PAS domain S-box-containing protein